MYFLSFIFYFTFIWLPVSLQLCRSAEVNFYQMGNDNRSLHSVIGTGNTFLDERRPIAGITVSTIITRR